MDGGSLAEIFAGLAGAVAVVGLLAAAAEAIVEGLIAPIFKRYELDSFWLFYISWAVSLGLVLVSGANLFADFIPADTVALAWVGRVLTGVVAGRGSNFVHDFFSAKRKDVETSKALLAAYAEDDAFYKELLDTDWRDTHIAAEE
jgi:hypothetical protein